MIDDRGRITSATDFFAWLEYVAVPTARCRSVRELVIIASQPLHDCLRSKLLIISDYSRT
jgi:hypothetical protein